MIGTHASAIFSLCVCHTFSFSFFLTLFLSLSISSFITLLFNSFSLSFMCLHSLMQTHLLAHIFFPSLFFLSLSVCPTNYFFIPLSNLLSLFPSLLSISTSRGVISDSWRANPGHRCSAHCHIGWVYLWESTLHFNDGNQYSTKPTPISLVCQHFGLHNVHLPMCFLGSEVHPRHWC